MVCSVYWSWSKIMRRGKAEEERGLEDWRTGGVLVRAIGGICSVSESSSIESMSEAKSKSFLVDGTPCEVGE